MRQSPSPYSYLLVGFAGLVMCDPRCAPVRRETPSWACAGVSPGTPPSARDRGSAGAAHCVVEFPDFTVAESRHHVLDENRPGYISTDCRTARGTETVRAANRRQYGFRWRAHNLHSEKHLALPTFVTSRNFKLTIVRTPSSSAVVRTCSAPAAHAEVRRVVISEMHLCANHLENFD